MGMYHINHCSHFIHNMLGLPKHLHNMFVGHNQYKTVNTKYKTVNTKCLSSMVTYLNNVCLAW